MNLTSVYVFQNLLLQTMSKRWFEHQKYQEPVYILSNTQPLLKKTPIIGNTAKYHKELKDILSAKHKVRCGSKLFAFAEREWCKLYPVGQSATQSTFVLQKFLCNPGGCAAAYDKDDVLLRPCGSPSVPETLQCAYQV